MQRIPETKPVTPNSGAWQCLAGVCRGEAGGGRWEQQEFIPQRVYNLRSVDKVQSSKTDKMTKQIEAKHGRTPVTQMSIELQA